MPKVFDRHSCQENAMRIIAGKWGSQRLQRPPSTTTRPMPDRVKEAIFNLLGTHYQTPGALPPIHVADIFAGSGSLGIEALSRGAASCRFFERGRQPLRILRENLTHVGAGPPAARVCTRDAWRAAADSHDPPFDLLFLDPPYVDSIDSGATGRVHRFLTRLHSNVPTDSAMLLILHHPAKVPFAEPATGWSIRDQRIMGTNGITIFER